MSKGTKTVVAKAAAKKVAAKAAPKAAAKPAAEKKAPASAAKKTAAKAPKKVTVVFEANCPLATTVSVAGSFNNWAVDKDTGDYEYKFVCDGQYWDEGDNKVKHV